jgi:type I restriction enzyme S subunit
MVTLKTATGNEKECPATELQIPKGYQQTEVGVIPKDWSVATIGMVSETSSGTTPSRALADRFYNNGKFAWVKTLDLNDSEIYSTEEKVTQAALNETSLRSYPIGSVIVAMYGGFNQIGRTGLLRIPATVNQALTVIRPDTRRLQAEYLQRVLNFRVNYWRLVASSSRKDPNISSKDIRNFTRALPGLEEQEAIAGPLSDADALIESLEQLIAKKRQIKQGAMQELLTGKKRLPGFGWEWQTRLLGEIITQCSSGATPYRGRSDYYKGKVKWITSGELNYNLITETVEHISDEARLKTNLKIHPVGTFLMAITGLEAAGTRGACGIVGSPATTNQSCMAIYPSSELKAEYLYHYYVLHGNDFALRYCQGTKQQSYTAKLVKLLPITLPPTVEEQTAIATVLSDMDAEIAALEGKLTKAKMIKQGMMQELLTGRIRLI